MKPYSLMNADILVERKRIPLQEESVLVESPANQAKVENAPTCVINFGDFREEEAGTDIG